MGTSLRSIPPETRGYLQAQGWWDEFLRRREEAADAEGVPLSWKNKAVLREMFPDGIPGYDVEIPREVNLAEKPKSGAGSDKD